jgi:regulator of protease activity HflC (stomatin/prohibitin superfamily)
MLQDLVMKYARAILIAAFALAGCEEPQPTPVAAFMESEVALFGTLERCQRTPTAVDEVECRNARLAAERIAAIEERAVRRTRDQAFESAREEYRAQLDRERALRIRAEAEAEAARLRVLVDPEGEAESAAKPAG